MQNFNNRLSKSAMLEAAQLNGTPIYVNSKASLLTQASELANLALPFGFIPRYAAKANMNPEIVRLFTQQGLQFDASSSYEAAALIELGVKPASISLSSQQPAHNLEELLRAGVLYTATSFHQLDLFLQSKARPNTVGLRVNPGVGAGENNRTTTGGVNSSFGLWHDYVDQALNQAAAQAVKIDRLHIHYGSGASPDIWEGVIDSALQIAHQMPDVTSLDIGGGFKVSRYSGEKEANLTNISEIFSQKLIQFAESTGRRLQLEIEPGTWLVAHAGTLLAEVVDIVDTGADGRVFLRVNTGMNDFIRPTMYGAQHEIEILNDALDTEQYVVVGHNCETSDILTPAPGNPEEILPRQLSKASIGDLIAIYDTGAYGRAFAVSGFNSFPSAKEILV